MTRKITIKLEDIEDFVLKKSDKDPIEMQIGDDRYEVLNFGIYDHKLKRDLPQSEAFDIFEKTLYSIRNDKMPEITKKSLALTLMASAPTEINL